jgi:hypothetical protein
MDSWPQPPPKKSHIPQKTTSVSIQTEARPFLNVALSCADIANSSKLIGRVSFSYYFDPWVNETVAGTPIDVDKNPCAYEMLCEEAFKDRFALHISHGCPSSLVANIWFTILTPSAWTGLAILDSDTQENKVDCESADSDFTCL